MPSCSSSCIIANQTSWVSVVSERNCFVWLHCVLGFWVQCLPSPPLLHSVLINLMLNVSGKWWVRKALAFLLLRAISKTWPLCLMLMIFFSSPFKRCCNVPVLHQHRTQLLTSSKNNKDKSLTNEFASQSLKHYKYFNINSMHFKVFLNYFF